MIDFPRGRTYFFVTLTAGATALAAITSTGKSFQDIKSLWHHWAKSTMPLETTWQGSWKARSGFKLDFAMQLDVHTDDTAAGRISWQLVDAPRDSPFYARIGSVASEDVTGHFNRDDNFVELTGQGVSDPTLLITDTYKFQIHPETSTFVGMTRNHGDWEAAASGTVLVVAKH